MGSKTIPVGQLQLDTENPRHEPVKSQRDAIQTIIAGQRQRLVVLANDIATHGLSPSDRLLVMKKGSRNYTVVEGNRRLAAIRLLNNPDIAQGTDIAAAIKRLADNAEAVPTEADCSVLKSRDEAEHWIELRHTGESGGAGVVAWNTLAKHRFNHQPGTQGARAIAFLEGLAEGFPKNDNIQELIKVVADKRLTTLGRLVQDPNFKDKFGMKETPEGVEFHFPADAIEAAIEHVLGDIGSDVTVSQLKSKDQRTAYLATVPSPPKSKRTSDAKPLSKAPATKVAPKKPRRRKTKPKKPFADLDLGKLGNRTEVILGEFRGIDVDKFPNAAALLTCSILELAVDDYIGKKGLSTNGELKTRIKRCLHSVDSSDKDPAYQGVRQGLNDGTSMFAVSTLHGFVHNPHFHPDGSAIRSIAANAEPFLQAMNDNA